MPFNLTKASEILSSKYKAKIEPYSNQRGFEAEIPFSLDITQLHIQAEVTANPPYLVATEAHVTIYDTRDSFHWERNDDYLKDPKVLDFLNQIRKDLTSSDGGSEDGSNDFPKCPACLGYSKALQTLWLQDPKHTATTEFNWHCDICGKDRRFTVTP